MPRLLSMNHPEWVQPPLKVTLSRGTFLSESHRLANGPSGDVQGSLSEEARSTRSRRSVAPVCARISPAAVRLDAEELKGSRTCPGRRLHPSSMLFCPIKNTL